MLNLVQLQERLKDVPMQALMQYANGTNPQVPPFLALGELNRRKKMQEGAAAEQAKEMEGAPTIKQQIEQAAGLMALQGNRQQQAAQQQQQAQATMPMAAPNTTTSEPAQMASGGFIDDVVVPRDYQVGGQVGRQINPEMLKKLMMLRAMKQRSQVPTQTDYATGGPAFDPEKLKQEMFKEAIQGNVSDIPKELIAAVRKAALRGTSGISSLRLPKDTFSRENFAKGGIVAFNGENDSYVERSPGFYQLKEELPEDEQKAEMIAKLPPEIRAMLQVAERQRQSMSPEAVAARRKAAGLPTLVSELPDTGAKVLQELQRQRAELEQSDTFANRLLALTPGRRFGTGETGKGLLAYEKERMAKANELGRAIASAEDLREKAKMDFAEGRFKEAEAALAGANKIEAEMATKIPEGLYKKALREQAEAGRTSTEDRAAQAYLRSQKAKGDSRPDEVILDEGYLRIIRERGAAFQRGETGAFQADVTMMDKARDNVDTRLKDFKSQEFRELNRRMAEDRKNAAAGNPTNLAEQYKNQLYAAEVAALRGRSSPQPSQSPRGSAPPPPPGFVPQK